MQPTGNNVGTDGARALAAALKHRTELHYLNLTGAMMIESYFHCLPFPSASGFHVCFDSFVWNAIPRIILFDNLRLTMATRCTRCEHACNAFDRVVLSTALCNVLVLG